MIKTTIKTVNSILDLQNIVSEYLSLDEMDQSNFDASSLPVDNTCTVPNDTIGIFSWAGPIEDGRPKFILVGFDGNDSDILELNTATGFYS